MLQLFLLPPAPFALSRLPRAVSIYSHFVPSTQTGMWPTQREESVCVGSFLNHPKVGLACDAGHYIYLKEIRLSLNCDQGAGFEVSCCDQGPYMRLYRDCEDIIREVCAGQTECQLDTAALWELWIGRCAIPQYEYVRFVYQCYGEECTPY